MYACQLWNNFLSSSLKRIRVAYNNSFRFLHGLAKYVNAREQQVLTGALEFFLPRGQNLKKRALFC